jgi:hypothetical protein
MRWSAVLVALPVMGSLDGKVAHLPLDHARIATIPSFQVDLVNDFLEK